jgi:hypothetical protein
MVISCYVHEIPNVVLLELVLELDLLLLSLEFDSIKRILDDLMQVEPGLIELEADRVIL